MTRVAVAMLEYPEPHVSSQAHLFLFCYNHVCETIPEDRRNAIVVLSEHLVVEGVAQESTVAREFEPFTGSFLESLATTNLNKRLKF